MDSLFEAFDTPASSTRSGDDTEVSSSSSSSESETFPSLSALWSNLQDIGIDKEKSCFNRELWKLSANHFQFTGKLHAIKGKIGDNEDNCVYYDQFVPHIMEDLRAKIRDKIEAIDAQNAEPVKIKLSTKTFPDRDYVQIHGRVATKVLPDKFSLESTMLHVPTANDTTVRVFAIVSKSFTSGDDDKSYPGTSRVRVRVSRDDSILLAGLTDVTAHWLGGLIPSMRMFDACVNPELSLMENQFTRCQLPSWPELDGTSLAPCTAASTLNAQQQSVVDRLCAAEEGMYLLQGPPGTGKSTVAVELLNRLVLEKRQERILLSAPSNKAVQVVLNNLRKKYPNIRVALLGTPREMPDKCEEVYVDGYVDRLVKQLDAKTKLIRDALNESPTEQWASGAFTASKTIIEGIFDKLNSLVSEETPILPSSNVVKAMKSLITSLQHSKCDLARVDASISSLPKLYEILCKFLNTSRAASGTITSFLLQRASIVFATLVASGRTSLQKNIYHFDTVIVDEAAQALIPALLIPLKYEPCVYIQMGDPLQLPATVTSNRCRQLDYGHSMMYWLMVRYEQQHQMLTVQYRMQGDICRWPSQQYYQGALVSDPGIAQRPRVRLNHIPDTWKNHSSLLINVNGIERREGHSISNDAEAKTVVNAALQLVVRNRVPAADIGIITYYAGQVEAIKALLKEKKQLKNISVSTVDGFQGDEKVITLVSTVRTNQSIGFVKSEERLNVVLTRARDVRWVFCHVPALGQSTCDWASLVRDHRERGWLRAATDLVN